MSSGSKQKNSSSEHSSEIPNFAVRSDQGVTGKPINVFTNHFPMKYSSDFIVSHYDVDMEPMRIDEEMENLKLDLEEKADKKRFKKFNTKIYRIVAEEAFKQYSRAGDLFDGVIPVFDGIKNLYSRRPLNLGLYPIRGLSGDSQSARIQVTVNIDGRDLLYAINIKKASNIDMKTLKHYFSGETDVIPLDAIQVLNIILRHGPTLNMVPIANSLYLPNELDRNRKDIGGGRQLTFGYFQSTRIESNGVSLVIDRTATAFYRSGPLIQFVAKILNLNKDQFMALKEFKDYDRKRVEKELFGIQIEVRHLLYKRKYKVIGLTQEKAGLVQFERKVIDPRGKEQSQGVVSLTQFFAENYPNVELKFNHLPAIKVGSVKNPNYLPIDVCYLVADQHVRKNLTTEQMADMIKSSASQTPQQRLQFIKDSAKKTIDESKIYLNEFGINFSSATPLKIEARVLLPPPLLYANGKTEKPFDGKWDVRSQRFFKPANLEHWIIVSFSKRDAINTKLGYLQNTIIESGQRLGLQISDATKVVTIKTLGPDSVTNIFKRAMQITDDKLQMILFVVNTQMQYLYESIKKVGDIDFGIVTQCLLEKNVESLRPPLVQNLMLKINTKLGGINAVLDDPPIKKMLGQCTMIVGVDSSHPGVGDRVSRSVSSCVASLDSSYVRYFATTRLQSRVQDMSNELKEMMKELITEYYERNDGILPEQIIIYRDGVSEGQFNAALQSEINGLAETFRKVRADYYPTLTYIVVQKRHHTRFFPANPSEGVGRAKNVPPGLVVDTDVVSKTYFDYFLCSHEGIQGTSRPTHYFILCNENKFSADQLQQLTFCLTHVYARCSRSISYPAPIAYAHLAAYRTQKHIVGYKQSEDSETGSSVSMSGPRRHGGEECLTDKIQVKTQFKSQMYFC